MPSSPSTTDAEPTEMVGAATGSTPSQSLSSVSMRPSKSLSMPSSQRGPAMINTSCSRLVAPELSVTVRRTRYGPTRSVCNCGCIESAPVKVHALPAGADTSSQCGCNGSPSASQLAVPSRLTTSPGLTRRVAPASAAGRALPASARRVKRRSRLSCTTVPSGVAESPHAPSAAAGVKPRSCTSTELSGVCVATLRAVRGPEPAPGLQGARLAVLQREGRLALPAHWAPNEALTSWIDFTAPVQPQAQLAWRADLDALEEVVAQGPFLGCEEGRYACIGASQVHWLSPTRAQYWVEGCATPAPWLDLLCNLLFATHGPAPALRVAITTE